MNETTAKLLYSDNIGNTLTTDKSQIIIATPFLFQQRVGSELLQKASYTFLQVRPEPIFKITNKSSLFVSFSRTL